MRIIGECDMSTPSNPISPLNKGHPNFGATCSRHSRGNRSTHSSRQGNIPHKRAIHRHNSFRSNKATQHSIHYRETYSHQRVHCNQHLHNNPIQFSIRPSSGNSSHFRAMQGKQSIHHKYSNPCIHTFNPR